MLDRDWALRTYDSIVSEMGTPTVAETRVEFAERYAEAVAAGRIGRLDHTLRDEGVQVFGLVVEPERNARRQSLLRSLTYLTDSLFSGEHADLDPTFAQAFPLGNGADKSLGAWTVEDYRQAAVTRYRGAAEQTAAAAEFDAVTNALVQQMEARGATTTADLFEVA